MPHRPQSHPPRRRHRLLAPLPAALLLATLILGALPGLGVAAPPPPEIAALLGEDLERQWSALARLREDPDGARAALVAALQREEPLPGRWRLVHRLVEFGTAEDLPLLLQLRAGAQNPWERRIVEGAARALYDPVNSSAPLEGVVQDFAFIQTGRPVPVEDPDRGKWVLSRWSLDDYHRDGVPLSVIKRLRPLRGRAYRSRDALAEALQKQLGPRDWKELHDRLLASVESVPPRAALQGLARVRLRNPLDRPLLLRIGLDAWYGRLAEAPEATWLYLEPGAMQTVDIPVRPQGSLDRPEVRLDLRLAEVNGPVLPSFHKLYLPLQF